MIVLITVPCTLVLIVALGSFVARGRRAQIRAIQAASGDAIVRWVILQDRQSYALVITPEFIELRTLGGDPSEKWSRSAVTSATLKRMGPSVPPRIGLIVHFVPQSGQQDTLVMFFARGDGFLNSPRLAREIQAVLTHHS